MDDPRRAEELRPRRTCSELSRLSVVSDRGRRAYVRRALAGARSNSPFQSRKQSWRAKRPSAQRKTKSEFFATIRHEIRTPLNSIIGYTSLVLARQNLNREDASDLAIVRDAGKALLAIVNDILDFSAIEQAR